MSNTVYAEFKLYRQDAFGEPVICLAQFNLSQQPTQEDLNKGFERLDGVAQRISAPMPEYRWLAKDETMFTEDIVFIGEVKITDQGNWEFDSQSLRDVLHRKQHPPGTEGFPARGQSLVINVPAWFKDAAFLAWLNDEANNLMSWHVKGDEPTEFSDTIVMVDPTLNGEGSDSNMPEEFWTQIVTACRQEFAPQTAACHIHVRLTNLA